MRIWRICLSIEGVEHLSKAHDRFMSHQVLSSAHSTALHMVGDLPYLSRGL